MAISTVYQHLWQKRLLTLLLRALLPLALVSALLVIQWEDPLFRIRLRDQSFDQLQRLHPAAYPAELPIRAVAIDDASLAAVGQWPWPRTVMGQVVDHLTALGARVIVIDMLMAEPDRTSPEQVKQFWPDNAQLDALLQQYPSHDAMLAESFGRSRVVTGIVARSAPFNAALPPRQAAFSLQGGDATANLKSWGAGVGFLSPLASQAAGSGVVTLVPDHDGILRSMPLLSMLNGEPYPALGLEALRVYLGADRLAATILNEPTAGWMKSPGVQSIQLGETASLPTSADGRVWLHVRPYAADRYLSAIDVLTGRVGPKQVKDHIVLIGATSVGLGDTVRNALGEAVPGVEAQVQLIENLLTSDYLLRPAWENTLFAALLAVYAVVIAWMLAYFRPVWTVMAVGAGIVALLAASSWLFQTQRLLLDPIFPTLSLVALFLSIMVPKYLRTEQEQRWIKTAFARYVSPNKVKYLQEHPETLALGGEYRECSFVMTDLAGFTSLIERYEPAMLSSMLNEYLDGMIGIAFAHEGTLDRVVGDAVAVLFSAPVKQADHAKRAVDCAMAMDEFANAFSFRQQARGIPFGVTRIGVNTGEVLVGNFGGQVMLDYRALGDAINTAARLETANGQLGTRISVSESTVQQCTQFRGRPAGRMVFKGKTVPIAVYEPLSEKEDTSDQAHLYRAAYALMEAGSPDAPAAFQSLQQQFPDDGLVAYHAGRLANGETGSLVVLSKK